jgi:DNA gyrase/topoisomerase IV subunit B
VDEALGGHCTRIEVDLRSDGSIEVRDNGRGIPVDVEPRTGLAGVEVVMTRLHAGGKFGGGSYAATGGLHGVGASVVNALAARLDVEVDRDGKTHAMSFRRGTPGRFGNGTPDSPFVEGSGLRVVGKVTKKTTGTRIRYWPDRQTFLKDASISIDELHNRPGRPRSWCRASPSSCAMPAARTRRSTRSGTTAASASSASSLLPTRPSATSFGCKVSGASARPCPCSTTRGT